MAGTAHSVAPLDLYGFYAESYQGIASVQISKGRLTNERQYYVSAIGYAAKAALATPKGSYELRGSSLAILGEAARKIGSKTLA